MALFRLTVLLFTAAVPAVALKAEADVFFELEALLDIEIHHRGESDGAQTGATEVESLGEGSEVSVTLSPEERAALHASKFEKEFVVDLDMSDAVDKKKSVGVVLDLDTDFEPVSVMKVKKTGILEAWNRMHPDKAVLVGDEIMKVNNIMWHHNSGTFAERIKSQFLASRAKLPGARDVLTLTIQRPRKEKETRYQSQREDLHRQLYSKDFVAEIPLKGVLPGVSLNQAMGWKLNATVDWMPISIEKMRNTGLVSMYNKEHPDAKIVAGDEILQVNHIQWHHNAKIFVGRLEAQFTAARNSELVGTPSNENVLKLSIRRPRSVSDTPEEQVYTKQYSAQLALKDARPLGWHLNKSSDAEPIVVEKIRRGSLLDSYNKANPEAMVRVGDAILKVNDLLWSGNTKEFADRIDKEFDISRPHRGQTPSDKTLNLVMQRRLVQPIMKEWTVTLPAGEGKILGWQLSHSEEEFPLTVSKVRSNGVVYEHNQEHPESKILPGDVIVKVNSVLWRQDSSSFEKRLNEQYSKSKATGNISLFLRRPVGVKDAFAEDKGRPFSHEFYIRLPIVNGQMMGWHLSSDNETAPIKVESVRNVGAVHDWNENNPFTDIQVGDHIAKVNNIVWHNNTQEFSQKLNLQMSAARKGMAKPMIQLLVQRPWRTAEPESKDDSDDDGVIGASEDVSGGGEDEMGATN